MYISYVALGAHRCHCVAQGVKLVLIYFLVFGKHNLHWKIAALCCVAVLAVRQWSMCWEGDWVF